MLYILEFVVGLLAGSAITMLLIIVLALRSGKKDKEAQDGDSD